MNKASKSDLGNKEIFSRNLKFYIEKNNIGQRELARNIGVSPSLVCDWCNGRAYPRMDKIQLLADYFKIDKSNLVEDEYVPMESITAEDYEVLELFHKVPVKKRELVLSMIRAAIDNL